MNDLFSRHIADIVPVIVALRRDLHAHPELAFAEHRTGTKVREYLSALPNVKLLPPLLGTDVVAILNPDRPGRCVAIRADMDALPIVEETDPAKVPYRSTVSGVMHACGHDAHTAMLVGTAMVLSRVADQMPGKVKFIFQPGEEDVGGAEGLCAKGAMANPKVDGIFALHAWPNQPVGMVSLRRGPAMAASCSFYITVHGQGSHGAYPQRGVDPILAAAHIVTALQTIVARNVAPIDAAVVTVGALSGGVASNVIPSECQMKGTIRYLRPEVGEHVQRRVREIAEHTAVALGAAAEVRLEAGCPPTINHERMCDLIERTAREVLGADWFLGDEPPSLGVEDFCYYGEHAPAAMFRLGVRPFGQESYPPLHNPRFDFNDEATGRGMQMFCELARRFLAT
ncbi:MAG TPA: M20 family metallopeptidase [Phycisphaerae bacterium]|nr:M20 family metallopeptidase [Phycisphaerae bacterium]HRY71501.1 M20 family metallopeptidase [Phycisphaerae bacterium]HSA30095.1 M20 family metallopeptidase [Phycisphaerae bacterium]